MGEHKVVKQTQTFKNETKKLFKKKKRTQFLVKPHGTSLKNTLQMNQAFHQKTRQIIQRFCYLFPEK